MKGTFLILMLIFVGLGSCGKRSVQLDRTTRRTIDTLSTKEINILRPELDSLCNIMFDSMVNDAIDSILEVRRLERIKITGE